MLQAIIFDHDGTLAPTMERQFAWFKYWWAHPHNADRVKGRPFPYRTLSSFMKMYNREILHKDEVQHVYDFLNLDCDMKDKSHPVWDHYKQYARDHPSGLYPGAREVVEELWKLGSLGNVKGNKRIRMSVNTSNSEAIVKSDLRKAGILDYFDSYVSKEILDKFQGGHGEYIKKPSKVSVALALDLLGVDGNRVIHIGDTLNDLIASKGVVRLGSMHEEDLIVVGNTWGYASEGKGKKRAREVLENGVEVMGVGRLHFDYIIDEFGEFLDIVKKHL